MDKTERYFLKTQELQPFVRVRYINHISLIWAQGDVELKKFVEKRYTFLSNIKFTYDSSKKRVALLDLRVILETGLITTYLHTKITDCHQ